MRGSSYMAPVPSSGFRGLPNSGRALRSRSTDPGESGGISSPAWAAASATSPHSPPEPVAPPLHEREGNAGAEAAALRDERHRARAQRVGDLAAERRSARVDVEH